MDIDNKMNNICLNLDFSSLCDYYNFLECELIELLSVDKRTLKSWLESNKAPMIARKLIAIAGRGYLPASNAWQGFKLIGGELHTPIGQRLTPERIQSWFYRNQLISSYTRTNEKLRRENERLRRRLFSSNDSIFKEDGTLKQLSLL